jgi:hypothetical protein
VSAPASRVLLGMDGRECLNEWFELFINLS